MSNFCGNVSIFVFSAMRFKLDFELEFLGHKITVIETNLHVRLYSNPYCEITVACANFIETLSFQRNGFNHKFSTTLELPA